jgi:hypothetical protein
MPSGLLLDRCCVFRRCDLQDEIERYCPEWDWFYGFDLPPEVFTDPDEIEDYLHGGDVVGDGPIPEHLLHDINNVSALEAYGPCRRMIPKCIGC